MALPIFAILAGLGAGVSAYGQIQAGKAQKVALKEQAKQEELAAESQELQRRQELNRALAANVAALSSGVISGYGTPECLDIASAKNFVLCYANFFVSYILIQAAIKRKAKQATQTAGLTAASTVLSGGAKAAQLAE